MRISWKSFWSTVTVFIAGAFAGIAVLAGLPTWIPVLVAPVAAATVFAAARTVVTRSPMFARVPPEAKTQIVMWIALAATAYAGWVITFVVRGDLWPLWLLVLLALGTLTYLVAWWHEYLLTLRPPARPSHQLPVRALPALEAGHVDDDPVKALFARVLARGGIGWLDVVSWERVTDSDGRQFGTRFKTRRPSRVTVKVDGKRRSQVAPQLPADTADRIAVAMSELTSRDYAPDWVTITNDENAAGVHYIQVNTEDVMAKPRPYHEDEATLTWTTVDQPAPVGYGMDARRFELNLCQHGRLIGGTQNGKSSAIHRLVAHLTTCEDAIVWAASVEKFYDLVGPWVEPYKDTGIRPPIDWMAATPGDLLDMLIAAMNIARWRQRQPMSARRGYKKLFVILDEFSFAARNTSVTDVYERQRVTIGRMIGMIAQGAASAGVYVIIATQRGTHDHLGDYGGDVVANMGWSAGLRSSDGQDTGRVVGTWKLPKIRHRGQSWIEPGSGEQPVTVKWEYIQTDDPSKPVISTGPTVSQVAWNRRRFQRDLDAGSVQAAGEAYAARHRYVTDELMAYLTGAVTDDDAPAEPAAADAGYAATLTLLRQRVPALNTDRPDAEPVQGGGAQVATMVRYRTRADRIREIVRKATKAKGGITRGGIIDALHAAGDEAGEQPVTNELTKLVRDGELIRSPDTRGLYQAAGQ